MLQKSALSLSRRPCSFIVALQLRAHSRADCCPVIVYSNGEQADEEFFLPSIPATPLSVDTPKTPMASLLGKK